MLWLLGSAFFLWCALREVRASKVPAPDFDAPRPVYKPYLALVLVLAAACAWPPVHRSYFEHFLSAKATVLAEHHRAKVHCNTFTDGMFEPGVLAQGNAYPQTGDIRIQPPWCDTLESYLNHPRRASENELWSLDLFTHESMHIRGEMNEAVTECEAVQRNYRAARLLGVPDSIAKRNALDFYNILYQRRRQSSGKLGGYYSAECAPGRALDEHLPDSTWAND